MFHSTYYGQDVYRDGPGRWSCYNGNGWVRADTLAGIRAMIRDGKKYRECCQ